MEINVVRADGAAYELGKSEITPLLIVNIASQFGLRVQYDEFKAHNQEYEEQGLAVLCFPSSPLKIMGDIEAVL